MSSHRRDRLGGLDRLVQLPPRVVQHAADAPQHHVDRAGADLDPVRLAQQLGDLLAREPVHPRQHRNMRMQPGPERAARHARRQLGQRRAPASRTRQPQTPPLAHLRRDHRQLPLLMSDRFANVFLAAGEPVPAPALLRQALHRPGRQLLRLGRRTRGPLMTWLRALRARLALLALKLLLRALPRQLPALLARQRRIRRRRHRTVTRVAVHLPLELLDPLLQPGHLTQPVKQPQHQLARGLPTRQCDRFRLASLHDRKIPSTKKESCSQSRDHLNAYAIRSGVFHSVG
jgi:hypothetical protein